MTRTLEENHSKMNFYRIELPSENSSVKWVPDDFLSNGQPIMLHK